MKGCNRYSRVCFGRFDRFSGGLSYLGTFMVGLLLVMAAPIEKVEGQTGAPNQVYGLGIVDDIAYSPNGTQVAVAQISSVGLYDVATRQRIVTFFAQDGWVTCVAFSADGKSLLVGLDNGTAELWDAATGAVVRSFSDHTAAVISVALSADGTVAVTGAEDNTAKLWNASTGNLIQTFAGHTGGVVSVAISSDGTRVLTGSRDNTARLWDASTGNEIRAFDHEGAVSSVAFSSDGAIALTSSWDDKARLWNVAGGNEIRAFVGHADDCLSAAFSPDETNILTASRDHTAKLWEAATGNEIHTFQGHPGSVISADYSSDGRRILTGSKDGTAKVWDAATRNEIVTLPGHSGGVTSVAYSPDGVKVLTGSWDGTAKLWIASTGFDILTFSGHADFVTSVAFSADMTTVLTGSKDKTAILWDAATGALIRTFTGHTGAVNSVAFSPDNTKVLTGSADNTAKLWNAATGAEIRTFTGHTDSVTSAAFSPDGAMLLTGSKDNTAKLWDVSTGVNTVTLQGHTDSVTAVAFDPVGVAALGSSAANGTVLTGSLDATAKLWNATTGAQLHTLSGVDTKAVQGVAFSPDGSMAVTCGYNDRYLGEMRFWNVADGKEAFSFQTYADLSSVALSPDGKKVLAGAGYGNAMLWIWGDEPDIVVNPITLDFGYVPLGTSQDQIVTVMNKGTIDLEVGAITDPAAPFTIEADNCSGKTIAPGNSCQVAVGFSPTAPGNFNSTFDIPSNDPDENPVTVNLAGFSGSAPDITVRPSPVDFGNVDVGNWADQIITVTNDGVEDLTIGTISAPEQPFSIEADNCSGQTIAPGDSCVLMVRFLPPAFGRYSSSFDIGSNDPDENPLTVPLIGRSVTEMCDLRILKAKIQPNKKGGYKAKIAGYLQLESNKDASLGVVVQIGADTYTEEVHVIEKKTTWMYKRPKGGEGGLKKLTFKWGKNTNPKRHCKKFSIATDTAPIFDQPPLGPTDVTISLTLGPEEGVEVISMTEKKGKLSYKAPK